MKKNSPPPGTVIYYWPGGVIRSAKKCEELKITSESKLNEKALLKNANTFIANLNDVPVNTVSKAKMEEL